MLTLIIIGMGTSTGISYLKAQKALKNSIVHEVSRIANSTSKIMTSWIHYREMDINNWSKLDTIPESVNETELSRDYRNKANKLLARLKIEYPYFEDLYVASNDGSLVAGSNTDILDKVNIRDRDYYKKAMKNEKSISKVIKSKGTGNPVFVIANPVLYKNEVIGVFFGVVDIDAFSREFVDEIKVGDSGYAYIYDSRGLVIAHPKKSMILKTNILDMSFGKEMDRMESGFIEYTWDGIPKSVAFVKDNFLEWTVAVGANNRELLAPIRVLGYFNLIIFVSVIAIAVIVIILTINSITKPLNDTVNRLKDIAEGEGDLTQRISVKTKDEIGDLASWFNKFLDNLQMIIKDIASNASILKESSTGLSTISGNMNESVSETTQKSNTVASASEELSSNINTIATATGQASSNLDMVAVATEQLTSSVSEIAKNSEQARFIADGAVLNVKKTSERVNELGDAVSSISQVTEVIDAISQQTNLLALNATIEAASAGEAGKGFAVVANEIKELAKQTSEATIKINEQISSVQSATQETVAEIEGINEVITNVNNIVASIAGAVEEQTATTQEISNNITQASTGIQEVNSNIAECAKVAGDISSDINEVDLLSKEMNNDSTKVENSSNELAGLAIEIDNMVGSFKV